MRQLGGLCAGWVPPMGAAPPSPTHTPAMFPKSVGLPPNGAGWVRSVWVLLKTSASHPISLSPPPIFLGLMGATGGLLFSQWEKLGEGTPMRECVAARAGDTGGRICFGGRKTHGQPAALIP